MSGFFGIDTSNYTTSAAVFDGGCITQNKRLLPVKEGQLGLRQSDAVFHHVQQLPQVAGAAAERGPPGGCGGILAAEGSGRLLYAVLYGGRRRGKDARLVVGGAVL